MTDTRLFGRLDPNFGWDGRSLYLDGDLERAAEIPPTLRGAATTVGAEEPARWRLMRDPLGLNKLFWARAAGLPLGIAARPYRLVEAGYPFEEVRSLPRGCVLDARAAERSALSLPDAAERSADAVAPDIRAALDRYLAALASAHPSARAFVCLSGGLDSSSIAALVREHFSDVVAVSFDLRTGESHSSEDRIAAQRLADDFGLPLLEVTIEPDELFGLFDTVLLEGIDWRDFNVHAGLVNAALARGIAAAVGDGDGDAEGDSDPTANSGHGERDPGVPALVFTGDLANEYLVDYAAESYRGSTYYELPRLAPAQLRANLVRGLDTTHREVGVFAAAGLPLIQPYAVAVDLFMALPPGLLEVDDRKQRLARAVLGDALPEYIYSRPKARAQTGGTEAGGILAACVDRGYDAAWLKQRFASLHGVADPRALDGFMRAGRYRAGVPPLEA